MPLPVRKTYKLFVGGKFPRSESGRSWQPVHGGEVNVARASRKDLRDAVVAARGGLASWHGSSAYLRGQVLYRFAEMLQSHRDALVGELRRSGSRPAAAAREVDAAIDLVVWYAGLPDKLPSLLGTQNTVNGPFFAFSTVEPCGVVGVLAPPQPGLLGLLALVLPVLVGGNAVVALVSEIAPCPGLSLGEILATSDLPAGTVNLLAGLRAELLPTLAGHRDVDGLLLAGAPDAAVTAAAAGHCARVRYCPLPATAFAEPAQVRSLLWVEPFVETKTLWHPVAP